VTEKGLPPIGRREITFRLSRPNIGEGVNGYIERSECQTPTPPTKVAGSKSPARRTKGVAVDQGSDFRPVATHACLTEVTVVPKRSRRLAAA
jgi:hypothetical protein